MDSVRVVDSRWGDNRAKQTSVEMLSSHTEPDVKVFPLFIFFGPPFWRIRVDRVVFADGLPMTTECGDEDPAQRGFEHTCGIIRLVLDSDTSPLAWKVQFGGHPESTVPATLVTLRIAWNRSEEIQYAKKPVATVNFEGYGTRYGPLHDYEVTHLQCVFANDEQMREYAHISKNALRDRLSIKGKLYRHLGNGRYRSDDGVMLPLPLVVFGLLSLDEQEEYLAENPTVRKLYDETD